MTINKYLEKIAKDADVGGKNMAKSYARVSTLSTLGGLAGAGIGALALGNRGAKKVIGKGLTASKEFISKRMPKTMGDAVPGFISKRMPKTISQATPRATGRYIKSRIVPWGAGAAAGAVIGHHVGGEIGEYQGIKGSINDLQKKSMHKQAILTKIAEMFKE